MNKETVCLTSVFHFLFETDLKNLSTTRKISKVPAESSVEDSEEHFSANRILTCLMFESAVLCRFS